MSATLLLTGLLTAAAPAAPYCPVLVRATTQLLVTRRLVITPVDCAPGQVARVRKRSVIAAEGPYKPIYPLTGAWTVPAGGSRNEWVGSCWQVEYFDGRAWQAALTAPNARLTCPLPRSGLLEAFHD